MGLGAYDLSADLGCCWDPSDPAHQTAIQTVRQAADEAGKRLWMGGATAELASQGYTFLWIGSVSSTLVRAFADARNTNPDYS